MISSKVRYLDSCVARGSKSGNVPLAQPLSSTTILKDVKHVFETALWARISFRIDLVYEFMSSPSDAKSLIYLVISLVDLQTKAYPFARFAKIEISERNEDGRRLCGPYAVDVLGRCQCSTNMPVASAQHKVLDVIVEVKSR